MEYRKVKSVAKQVSVKGPELERIMLRTMAKISSVVGATLGPGGNPVLVERYEHGLPASITKDGVSVFRSLGFEDPLAHCIMEAARDAAIRTATEAGDGTTTATVLAEALVRKISEFCNKYPKQSPQKIVRRLESIFKNDIDPLINALSVRVDFDTPEGKEILKSVARISANGDEPLAEKVMECFEITGDQGNVTITESSGPSSYEVEKVEGYPISIGYEESCAKYFPKFINDQGNQRTFMEKCLFIVHHGPITEFQALIPIIEKIGTQWEAYNAGQIEEGPHNVVVVATGFSDNVLGTLAVNFPNTGSINVFPLVAPKSPQINGQLYFLEDVCATTGATLLDPLNKPLQKAELAHLGPARVDFEAYRFRSTILGMTSEDLIIELSDVIEQLLKNPESELDKMLLQERLAKVTGGIARLRVIGASSGELKEKRDRAEDAVCAVKGAIKYGCLPGGGWTLLKIMHSLEQYASDPVVTEILGPALYEPVDRLLSNSGLNDMEKGQAVKPVVEAIERNASPLVFDALEMRHVDAMEMGILDSTPAVREALRNSLSIASLLGTLGGAVVFGRDTEFERSEATSVGNFVRETNEANLRG